jgi:predicted NAD/FAD-dependent oxidoreductase
MATRRMDGARIDHGAQFMTVRHPHMQGYLSKWLDDQVVCPWYDQVRDRADLARGVRYRGMAGMTSPVKSLAHSSRIETNFFVDQIKRREQWVVTERMGEKRELQADHLVITFPVPQVLELFERSAFSLDSATMNRLRKITYTRCIALLGLLDKPSSLSAPGTLTHPVPEVDWVSDNQIKGVSEKPAFTLHASDSYSQRFWDVPDEQRYPFLIGVAEQTLGAKVTQWSSHRWGFAKPLETFGATHFHSLSHSLTLAGDGFGGERIENAFLSGWDAAQAVTDQNRNR